MGIAADSLFNALMSWVRALVNALWALFSADRTTALEFLGKNWMMIAAVIIVGGLVIDWIIWLIRWQPYHLWARRLRRMFRLDEPDEEPEKEKKKAKAAVLPEKRYMRPQAQQEEETEMYLHGADEGEEYLDLEEMPEEEFAYPGMRYGSTYEAQQDQATRRHSVLTQEGPGAAEVMRRRAEIDAWQLQMQQEARARAQAEQEERERLAREAEQARIAQAAYEAEQERLAQQAYEEEQARLAQEEYERQMAEYERQKAQYERDLAEYERQKAEYEAQIAAQEAQQAAQAAAAGSSRRRRTAMMADEPEMMETQVHVPVRPVRNAEKRTAHQMTSAQRNASERKSVRHEEKKSEPAENKSNGLLGRVAKMIEPEEEELITRKTLPPRVDMNDAFRTAKLPVVTPPGNGRRKK